MIMTFLIAFAVALSRLKCAVVFVGKVVCVETTESPLTCLMLHISKTSLTAAK